MDSERTANGTKADELGNWDRSGTHCAVLAPDAIERASAVVAYAKAHEVTLYEALKAEEPDLYEEIYAWKIAVAKAYAAEHGTEFLDALKETSEATYDEYWRLWNEKLSDVRSDEPIFWMYPVLPEAVTT